MYKIELKEVPIKYFAHNHYQLWCDQCDHELVDSKEENGKFFYKFGHVCPIGLRTDKELGKWERVVFSICNDCLQGMQ